MDLKNTILNKTSPHEGMGRRLSGNMGIFALAMTVLAFSAPLTVLSGYIPFALMFGGVGTPIAFAVMGVVLIVFSVGFVTLNSIVKRPGDFYAFISYGLGKSAGLGAGLLAAAAYFLIVAGITAFFGIAFTSFLKQLAITPYPWYVYSAFAWVLVGTLGFLHIELSARVLGVVMLLEILVCLLFSFGVLSGAEPDISRSAPFKLNELLVNTPALAFLFGVSFSVGFESTALYRDEVKNPDLTIPWATYGSVIFMAVLYTFGSYAMVLAYGADVAAIAENDPASMFPTAFAQYIDPRLSIVVTILVLGSSFAATLSAHNVLSRYLFNLGSDGAMPVVLGKIHPRHNSPHIASITASIMTVVILAPFIVGGANTDLLFGQLAAVAAAGVTVLMTIVNFASLAWYFSRGRHQDEVSAIKSCICPAISSICFIAITWLTLDNFHMLAGGEPGEHVWMFYAFLSIQLVGIVLAQYFKRARPEVYAGLGRSHIGGQAQIS